MITNDLHFLSVLEMRGKTFFASGSGWASRYDESQTQ